MDSFEVRGVRIAMLAQEVCKEVMAVVARDEILELQDAVSALAAAYAMSIVTVKEADAALGMGVAHGSLRTLFTNLAVEGIEIPRD